MSLGTLTVDLVMKTGKFESDTKRAEKRAKQMAKNIDTAISQVGAAFISAAAVGLTAFSVGIKNAVDNADEIGKMAQKIGVTTEALSQLSFAASQAGVEQGSLQKALAKVAVDLTKNDSLIKALGITATTADGALLQLADKFNEMPDGLEKTAAAAKIFGERIGPDLIPLLNQGSKGIQDLKDKADDLGATISTQMARDAEIFNDTMDQVKVAMQGAFLKVAQDLLPKMQQFADYMSSPDFADKMQTAVSGIGGIVIALAKLGEGIIDVTQYWGNFAAEIATGSTAGASGNRKYIESRIDNLKDPLGIGADFSNTNGRNLLNEQTTKKLREFQALLAEENLKDAYSKIDFSNFEPPKAPKPSGKKLSSILVADSAKGRTPKLTDAEREANQLQAAYESLNANMAERIELYGVETEYARVLYDTTKGELAGLTQAKKDELLTQAKILDSKREEAELQELGKRLTMSVLTVEEELNLERIEAKRLLDAQVISFETYTKALENLKSPAEQELQRLRDEVSLLGLSNEEREKRLFLLNNPGATPEEAIEFGQLLDQKKQIDQTKQAMDQFRSSAADAFEGFLDGSMSAKDAFESFADSVVSQIARILAQQAIESLFGGFGGTGGGLFGGGIGGIFSSLFGGGRANGGGVNPNTLYRVNENGPEMLTYQGKDFLMMGQGAGMVRPNAGGSNVTVNVSPTTERRTALQIAQRVSEKQRLANTRNG